MCPPDPVFQKVLSPLAAESQVIITVPPAAYHEEPSTPGRVALNHWSPCATWLFCGGHNVFMSSHSFGVTHMKSGAVLLVRSLVKFPANGTTWLQSAGNLVMLLK